MNHPSTIPPLPQPPVEVPLPCPECKTPPEWQMHHDAILVCKCTKESEGEFGEAQVYYKHSAATVSEWNANVLELRVEMTFSEAADALEKLSLHDAPTSDIRDAATKLMALADAVEASEAP